MSYCPTQHDIIMLRSLFIGGLIILLLTSCARNQSGFITDLGGLSPISDQYELPKPEIRLPNPSESTLIIYSHATTDSWRLEN